MLEFILKYWIEVLFSVFIAVFSFFWKKIQKAQKIEKKEENDKLIDTVKKEIAAEGLRASGEEQTLKKQINALEGDLQTITKGILSIQRRAFEADCRALLDENHEITLDEFQQIDKDHEVYNSLGGNHNGDRLFELVKKKAEHCFCIIDGE